ncbi:hypothetical protein [Actinomadura sp. 6N118]|uniref:hypothetical protein n=1 Tax=Actinomadura sp. 6N118 TaxID=3375151 RepID=UPI0037BDFD68
MPTLTDLADALFASALQESDRPTPNEVRSVAEQTLRRHGADCLCRVAQEAGDHPEEYTRRMRWALREVEGAYGKSA